MYPTLIKLTDALLTEIKAGTRVAIWPLLPLSYSLIEDGEAGLTLTLCTQAYNGKRDVLYLRKKDNSFVPTGGSILGLSYYKLKRADVITGLNLLYEALLMGRPPQEVAETPRYYQPLTNEERLVLLKEHFDVEPGLFGFLPQEELTLSFQRPDDAIVIRGTKHALVYKKSRQEEDCEIWESAADPRLLTLYYSVVKSPFHRESAAQCLLS